MFRTVKRPDARVDIERSVCANAVKLDTRRLLTKPDRCLEVGSLNRRFYSLPRII